MSAADPLLVQATDWRRQVRLLGPRQAPWALPVVDVVLGAVSMVLALSANSFISSFGNHPAYVMHLVLSVVIAAAQVVRKRLVRLSFVITAVGLAAYSLLTLLSPVNLGLSPLACTALCGLHAVVRWCPQEAWRRGAVGVALAGSLVNPEVTMLLGRNPVFAVPWRSPAATLIVAVASVAACALAVVVVASDARQRRRLAVERLRVVAQERAAAVGAERLGLARELHDLLGHSLTAIRVRSATALAVGDQADLSRALDDIERTAGASLNEMRDLVRVLRSPSLAGPVADLGELETVVAQARSAGLELSVEGTPLPEVARLGSSWSALQRLAVLRTVQEGLTNAMRHGTGSASLRLLTGQTCQIRVTNPVDGRAPAEQGAGLAGLAERVELVGGSIEAGPRALPDGSAGFQLAVTLPVRAQTKADGATRTDGRNR